MRKSELLPQPVVQAAVLNASVATCRMTLLTIWADNHEVHALLYLKAHIGGQYIAIRRHHWNSIKHDVVAVHNLASIWN